MSFIDRLFNKPYDRNSEELKHYNDPCNNINWLDKYIYSEAGGKCTQGYYTVQDIYNNNINGIELVKLLKSYRIMELNLAIMKMSNDLITCNINSFSQLFSSSSICDDFLNDLAKNLFTDIKTTITSITKNTFSVCSVDGFKEKVQFSINIHFMGRINIIRGI